jgi:RNA binding exosome subunit
LEQKYNMPRVIREGILGNPTMYSEFNVNRAKELEDIAEKIRKAKAG